MADFFYIYVLLSKRDGYFYTGFTRDLQKRLSMHQSGYVESTKRRQPFQLIYWEGCLCQADATRREKYLKSTWGKRYLRNRLRDYLTG
ncbi:MAG: GIY-YIG nuclease family protein [Deltaproteobacteria bacterium]|nr:GIY-YIG nuclease family protein [Deltaproteobacteria bacterium]